MTKTGMRLVFLFLVPTLAAAQTAKESWENLKQLRAGQKVEVVDAKMKTSNGKFISLTDEAITLREGKNDVTLPRAEVVRVSIGNTSHRMRNVLLGAGIGGGIAIAATAVPLLASSNEGNGCAVCAAGIAAGFGGGAALGLIPGHKTIYRATSTQGSTLASARAE